MANTPTTTMRFDPELRVEAIKVLDPMGLDLSSAVNIFLRVVVRERRLSFEIYLKENSLHPTKTEENDDRFYARRR